MTSSTDVTWFTSIDRQLCRILICAINSDNMLIIETYKICWEHCKTVPLHQNYKHKFVTLGKKWGQFYEEVCMFFI